MYPQSKRKHAKSNPPPPKTPSPPNPAPRHITSCNTTHRQPSTKCRPAARPPARHTTHRSRVASALATQSAETQQPPSPSSAEPARSGLPRGGADQNKKKNLKAKKSENISLNPRAQIARKGWPGGRRVFSREQIGRRRRRRRRLRRPAAKNATSGARYLTLTIVGWQRSVSRRACSSAPSARSPQGPGARLAGLVSARLAYFSLRRLQGCAACCRDGRFG